MIVSDIIKALELYEKIFDIESIEVTETEKVRGRKIKK
jgi:hypothetical protein